LVSVQNRARGQVWQASEALELRSVAPHPAEQFPPLAAPVRLRNKMGELLSAVVADDKAGVQFLNRPRRPEFNGSVTERR
jgi:hypothetical protein